MEKKKKAILDLQFYDSVLNKYNPTFWRDARVRHFRYRYFTVSQLMHFDVHLGGNERDIIETSYWFLYGRRKGFVFIDLHPTVLVLRRLILIITEVIKNYGKFMFVDSDRQYCWGTQRLAIQVGEAYCIYSWVGGLLTNFKKIWAFYNVALRYTDWGLLRRPKARLKFILQGLDALYGPPSLIFINRLEHGHNAAAESHAVSIPSIGLVDLNTYSDEATYLIPSNDDSKRTVSYFNQLITRAVMKSKLHRALSFIRRKNLREQRGNLILEDRLIDMRKMFDVYKSLETRHTVHFRMPLRDWAALRKARTVFLGFPIPYLSTKTAISFIFKRLRREYFIDRERLNTLRKLKQKASFIYKRYYAQFFNVKPRLNIFRDITDKPKLRKELFTVTSKKHHKRFPIKVLDILQKVRWLFDLRYKYRHLSSWFKWKIYKQYKDTLSKIRQDNKVIITSSSEKNRLNTLSRFYKFLSKEYYRINKLYFYYIKHYYKPLKFFFQKWKKKPGFTLFEQQLRGKNKKTLGEEFNEWYFGKRFYETNIKKDAHFIWQRLLLKYDVMKRRDERNKSLRDFRLKAKSQPTLKTLQTSNNQIRSKTFESPKWDKHSTMKSTKPIATIGNRNANVKKHGHRLASNKFVKSFRQRNRNPYSWRFRRLWKPRRISHFFKLNPYYLALLRNRPWFPMREIIRFQLEEPQNPNQFILKDKVLYNLLNGNLNYFLTDKSFATHRDFFSFPQRVSFEGDFLYFPKRLLRSRSVDHFRPISFFDIIPRDLHWYYNYWNLKLDPKRFLNYFKLLHTNPDHTSRLDDSERYMYNFHRAILEIQKEKEKSTEEKDLEMKKGVDNAPVFNIWKEVIDKKNQSLFYRSFAANNPQLHKIYNKPVFRQQQLSLDRSKLFWDFYKNAFIDLSSKISTESGSKRLNKQALSLRAKSRLKMLQKFSENISWASDYYELINYNRSWMQSYSVFFDNRDMVGDYKSFEDKLILNKWNLITHLHRYQKTPSFLNLFILGRVKVSENTAKIQSPHLRRLKRKIDRKRQRRFMKQQSAGKNYFRRTIQSDPKLNIKQDKGIAYRQSVISTRLGKKVKHQKWSDKRLSSYYLMKKKQKMDSLKKLFPFYFWLRWFKGLNLLSLFQKNMVHSYLLVFNKTLNRFKRVKNLKTKIKSMKQLFSLFTVILRLLVYKTGNLAVFKVLSNLNQSLNLGSRPQLSENIISYFSKFLNHVNVISDEKRPSKHAKFVSLSYFWRWFYKNTAKAYFKPNPIFASDGFALIDLYHRKSVFFNRHGFMFLRDNAFSKATNFYGKKDKFAFEKAHYDYLAGIPDRTAQRIFMKMNSKFNYNKYQKFFWLKLSQRFRGRVFLEALFNDFKYGKIKSPRHYRMMREVVYRLHHINKQRHSIFVEMFQNNPYVDRPHLKANIDKYSGSHLFLLKNYGPKRFLRKRKFDTLDVFYFMGWFLRHKKGVPANLRRKFMFLFRMWNNKSMFLSS